MRRTRSRASQRARHARLLAAGFPIAAASGAPARPSLEGKEPVVVAATVANAVVGIKHKARHNALEAHHLCEGTSTIWGRLHEPRPGSEVISGKSHRSANGSGDSADRNLLAGRPGGLHEGVRIHLAAKRDIGEDETGFSPRGSSSSRWSMRASVVARTGEIFVRMRVLCAEGGLASIALGTRHRVLLLRHSPLYPIIVSGQATLPILQPCGKASQMLTKPKADSKVWLP